MEETGNAPSVERRPLALTMLSVLYLFFMLVSASTFGNPFPFLGTIYDGAAAKTLVFVDCLCCVYLFLGLMQRQRLTWYLLLGYNLFQIVNVIVNLNLLSLAELEAVATVIRQDTGCAVSTFERAVCWFAVVVRVVRSTLARAAVRWLRACSSCAFACASFTSRSEVSRSTNRSPVTNTGSGLG